MNTYKQCPLAIIIAALFSAPTMIQSTFAAEELIIGGGGNIIEFNSLLHDGELNTTVIGTQPLSTGGNGAQIYIPGEVVTIKALNNDISQSFDSGDSGYREATLAELQGRGQVVESIPGLLNKDRLNLGSVNSAITIPDPITGGKITMQTYDESRFNDPGKVVDGTGTFPDYYEVNGKQYIDMRIAELQNTGGQIIVDLGMKTADHTDSTNQLILAAKQSTLFEVDGSGAADSIINWDTNNRVTFNAGTVAQPTYKNTINNFADYHGPISVTTLDGVVWDFNVTDLASLRSYNYFLREQLSAGNLEGTSENYKALFDQAVTISSGSFQYEIEAQNTADEVFNSTGTVRVIHATGAQAQVNINSVLEVYFTGGHANKSGVELDNGAAIKISENGVLAGLGAQALDLASGSTAQNEGVININFLSQGMTHSSSGVLADGTIKKDTSVGEDDRDRTQIGIGVDNSSLLNNGVININSGTGIFLTNASTATNHGSINIGIANTANGNNTTNGVIVDGATDSFINEADGEIYIGRGPQSNKNDLSMAETNINHKDITSGVLVNNNGSAINSGIITLGTKVQNSAALHSKAGNDTTMINSGTIKIQGNAATIPSTNYGMLVENSGLGGNIKNDGLISLEGVNAIGVKIISTGAGAAYASTTGNSVLDIIGQASPDNGTRNYGVWVEGQDTGQAYGYIDGDILLKGDGAIGVHARGRALVSVLADAVPQLSSGKEQIVFFAYGDHAKIIVGGAHNFDVATEESTFFRMENGADFDEGGLQLETSAKGSMGIVGTGKGSEITLTTGTLITSGESSKAMIIEGGATGLVDNQTLITQSGNFSKGIVVDGKKHDLTGQETAINANDISVVTSAAQINSQGNPEGLIGYDVMNGGQLAHSGQLNYTAGQNHVGINVTGSDLNKKSEVTNEGAVYVNHGTGISLDGAGTNIDKVGTVKVDDGIAGLRLAHGATATITAGTASITTGGTAHGILMDVGAAQLISADTTLNVSGTGSGIENAAETSNIQVVNNVINVNDGSGIRTGTPIHPFSSAQIKVSGSGSGFGFKMADGSQTSQNLHLGGGMSITGAGAGSIGIEALTSNIVDTAAFVNMTHDQSGPALLAGTAKRTTNIGRLTSESSVSPVVDLANGTGTQFNNSGDIIAKTAIHDAVRGSSGGDTLAFSNSTVRGEINSGTGEDFVVMYRGQFEGGISMEGINSTTMLKEVDMSKVAHAQATPGNNNLIFDDVQLHGGSFAQDNLAKGTNLNSGWTQISLTNGSVLTLTDHLTLAGSIVEIDATSILYAGNNVRPVISSNDPQSLFVLNQGTIDLTNGNALTDQLTIRGNYYSINGLLRMNSLLNTGGALSNQVTDRLLVEQDVIDVTTVDIVPSGIGEYTDINRDGIIQNNEGISVIQVAGMASDASFMLFQPVIAGAFSYTLYSFAPGLADASQRLVSGTGNQFWDYRLANEFVCPPGEVCRPVMPSVNPNIPGGEIFPGEGPVAGYRMPDNSRVRLAPQVPSYISLPSAVSDYQNVITDDLHKRLGEIRHDYALDQAVGEVYTRYIGAQNKYKTNVSFKNFGFDYDLDINAIQMGMDFFKYYRNNHDQLRAGLAYTSGTSKLKPDSVDGYSKTTLTSNTLALYLTWQKPGGFYVDTVLSYNHHKAKVETSQVYNQDRMLRAKSWLASVETGYPFKFNNGYMIEPQLQVTYQTVAVKNFKDVNNAYLRYDDYDQTTVRVGVRGHRTWVSEKGTQHTPYVRANYYHNFGSSSQLKISTHQYSDRNIAFSGGKRGKAVQIGVGYTGTTKNNKLSFFGEIDYQKELGHSGSKGIRLNAGVKWLF